MRVSAFALLAFLFSFSLCYAVPVTLSVSGTYQRGPGYCLLDPIWLQGGQSPNSNSTIICLPPNFDYAQPTICNTYPPLPSGSYHTSSYITASGTDGRTSCVCDPSSSTGHCVLRCEDYGQVPPPCAGYSISIFYSATFEVPNLDCTNPQTELEQLACPSQNCSFTQSGADSLLAQAQASCEAKGDSASFNGGVFLQTNSFGNAEYCVFGACEGVEEDDDRCPIDSASAQPKMLSKPIFEESEIYTEPSVAGLKPKSNYYNAKGQVLGLTKDGVPRVRTPSYSKANVSPFLHNETENDLRFVARRSVEECSKCGVDSFKVTYRDVVLDPYVPDSTDIPPSIMIDKIGIAAEFYASFKQGDGYDPACCEYQQKYRGTFTVNDSMIIKTRCPPNGLPPSDLYYLTDSFSREFAENPCGTDSGDTYIDSIGVYKGNDYPGLPKAAHGDDVYLDYHFKSYIQDRCHNNKIVSPIIDWGFTMDGIVPNQTVEIRGAQYDPESE